MACSFFRDDNAVPLHDGAGLRPDFSTVARATTGASITELSLSSLNIAGNRSERGLLVIRVCNVGSNACYFSLGAASSAPGANTAMIQIPANTTHFFKATAKDASAYHQQITGATALEVAAMV